MELKATRPAAYSGSPQARSFHTITMAIQRAMPIMIRPTSVFRIAVKKNNRQKEHENRSDYPVLDKRETEYLFVSEDLAEFFILYFCERRIHHKNKPDSDRNVGGTHLKFVDESFGFRYEIPRCLLPRAIVNIQTVR